MNILNWLAKLEKKQDDPKHLLNLALTCTRYDLQNADISDQEKFIQLVKSAFSHVDAGSLQKKISAGEIQLSIQLLKTIYNERNQDQVNEAFIAAYPWLYDTFIDHKNGKVELDTYDWNLEAEELCKNLLDYRYFFYEQSKENKKSKRYNLIHAFFKKLKKKDPDLMQRWNKMNNSIKSICKKSIKEGEQPKEVAEKWKDAFLGTEYENGHIHRKGIAQGKKSGIVRKFFIERKECAFLYDEETFNLMDDIENSYSDYKTWVLSKELHDLLKYITPYFKPNSLRQHILNSFWFNSPLAGRPPWRVVFTDLCVENGGKGSREMVQGFHKLISILDKEGITERRKEKKVLGLLNKNTALSDYLSNENRQREIKTMAVSIDNYSILLEKSYVQAENLFKENNIGEIYQEISEFIDDNQKTPGMKEYREKFSLEMSESGDPKETLISFLAHSPEVMQAIKLNLEIAEKKNISGIMSNHSALLEKQYTQAKHLLYTKGAGVVYEEICEFLISNTNDPKMDECCKEFALKIATTEDRNEELIKAMVSSPELMQSIQSSIEPTHEEEPSVDGGSKKHRSAHVLSSLTNRNPTRTKAIKTKKTKDDDEGDNSNPVKRC
jgi:hypothetical protein